MWWNGLTDYQQILFIVAVAATSLMVLLILLMLIGFDNSEFDGFDGLDGLDGLDSIGDIDGVSDFDGSVDVFNNEPITDIGGLKILTIRGVLAFFSMGSWVTMLMLDYLNPWISTLIGAVAGFIAAYLLAYALNQALKLENSGNIDYRKAIGSSATVYMRVPKDRSGKGKVNLVLEDRYVELEAITDDEEDILSNKEVKVVGLSDRSTLIVTKASKK